MNLIQPQWLTHRDVMVRTGGSSVDKHRAKFKAPLLCCRAALHFPNDILQRNISGLGPKAFIKANKCFTIVFFKYE